MRDTFDKFSDRGNRGRFGDNENRPEYSGRVNGASNLVDVMLALHHSTALAYLVSPDGNNARAIWLAKSQVEAERTGEQANGMDRLGRRVRLDVVRVTLPMWIAREKGLV